MRLHKKVWVWWGPWWAVQFVAIWWEAGLGAWLELRRPLLDLHLLWLTLSIGRHPALTDERWKRRHAGRGFLYRDDPLIGAAARRAAALPWYGRLYRGCWPVL